MHKCCQDRPFDAHDTKKKKSKSLIILLIIFGFLVSAMAGVYLFFNSQVEKIINEINLINPSCSTLEADYNALTPVVQVLFRDKIVNAFVDEVSNNIYSSPVGKLVDEFAIDKYSIYEKIGNVLNISSDDGTNVMSHIDAVLSLELYEKQNGFYKCVFLSIRDFDSCKESVLNAMEASSYDEKRLYLGVAHLNVKAAITSAKADFIDDERCIKYINALEIIENELKNACDEHVPLSRSFTSAIKTADGIMENVMNVIVNVKEIEKSIPEIYK